MLGNDCQSSLPLVGYIPLMLISVEDHAHRFAGGERMLIASH